MNTERRCITCKAAYAATERFCPLDGGAVIDGPVDEDPRIGTTIDGRYSIRRLLGRGGMGAVYEAEHVGLDRRVAIKFVLDADTDAIARFRREARVASRIDHPNVVKVFDVGTTSDGVDFIAMELVEGIDLRKLMKRDGALAPAFVARIGAEILSGLQAIHDAGILHRDIKPGNILLVERDGREVVKIMDFGISKRTASTDTSLTATGQVVGTPQFMAPEQIAGGEVDHRADLYAVGVTLYALLAGEVPFDHTSFTVLAAKHLLDAPPALTHVPATLASTIDRALAKRAADRFASAAEFARALAATQAAGETQPMTVDRRAANEVHSVSTQPRTAVQTPRQRIEPPPPKAATAPPARWPIVVGIAGLLGVAGAVTYVALGRSASRGIPPRPTDAAVAAVVPPRPVDAAVEEPAPLDAPPVDAAVAAVVPPPRDAGVVARPIANDGVIEVRSQPPGARILLDGKPRGSTPTRLDNVARGPHTLVLELADFERISERILVAGGPMTVSRVLAPVNPYDPLCTPDLIAHRVPCRSP